MTTNQMRLWLERFLRDNREPPLIDLVKIETDEERKQRYLEKLAAAKSTLGAKSIVRYTAKAVCTEV